MLDYEINVCLACDDNYARYAGVVIASILKNSESNDKIAIYLLDGGISQENKMLLRKLSSIKDFDLNFIKIDEDLFKDYKSVKTHNYITLPTFYRLKLPTLLPDINKIIYFDCDFIVNSSLKELFNIDLQGYPLGGVHDIKEKMVRKNPTYVNAGMLVMDLAKFRELDLESAFLDWTKNHIDTIKVGDQEIINEVCKGKIAILPKEWNVQSSNFTNRSCYTNKPKAIHFIAKKKPWHFASFSYHKGLYFKYLQLTPWAMGEEELKYWTTNGQIVSIFEYLKYRPIFFLRPKFYKAFFFTYILPLFKGESL